ncbi:MAG: proton extrusion protein PcxA [Coleofasciculaceae cyanobacterium SM2_1_6]|nr:proton extrusion protein PcxA [Coleofasciculaceae cyanobacterium SM2_1_6]
MGFIDFLYRSNEWFLKTPERSLEEAYKAALKIKQMEDDHFNGRKIALESADYGLNTFKYFQEDLNKLLGLVKGRLAEFRVSRSLLNPGELQQAKVTRINPALDKYPEKYRSSPEAQLPPSIIISKLNFIDEILDRYSPRSAVDELAKSLSSPLPREALKPIKDSESSSLEDDRSRLLEDVKKNDRNNMSDSTGLVPRTILGTFSKIQRDLDPKSEQEYVSKYRSSKLKTSISVKFILTLIIVPILTQQFSKAVIITPLMHKFVPENKQVIFVNEDLQREALEELDRFARNLDFQAFIGRSPELSPTEKEKEIRQKAQEIADDYKDQSNNSIKNIFADLISITAFITVLLTSKKEITILKSFIDDLAYGLSDSAKAFIIILLTDMFVGFHSPHGWEIVLERTFIHLGIAENRDFNFLFIATFPVILDSIIKYWIFRYLNRISPSAVATYKDMNE